MADGSYHNYTNWNTLKMMSKIHINYNNNKSTRSKIIYNISSMKTIW